MTTTKKQQRDSQGDRISSPEKESPEGKMMTKRISTRSTTTTKGPTTLSKTRTTTTTRIRKALTSLLALLLASSCTQGSPLGRKSLGAQLGPNYVRAMAAYKRLEPKLPRSELRALTTIGILNGAVEAEHRMEQHLVESVKDLLLRSDRNDVDGLMPKIETIERQLLRNRRALEILGSAMDLASRTKSAQDFRQEMQQMRGRPSKDAVKTKNKAKDGAKIKDEGEGDNNNDMDQRVASLRRNILQHVTAMKQLVEQKVETTLGHLMEEAGEDGLLARVSHSQRQGGLRKRETNGEREGIRLIKSILTEDDFRQNLVDNVAIERRKDTTDDADSKEDELALDLDLDDLSRKVLESRAGSSSSSTKTKNTTASKNKDTTATSTTTTTTDASIASKPAKQELLEDDDDSPELGPLEPSEPGTGGGLVGLIASLSGGEGGSDVGALIGALTGVVSTLFGPGGLDVDSLINSATSLISGLLSGNQNFGTVLGSYVGTAFDGLSGGGGAINNGQFVGNFLGTVVASLSADPEDDDEPPKPLVFVQNLIGSFLEAKNRKGSGETSEERNGPKPPDPAGGSDSAGFIKQIVSHVVGSAVSLILNASLGASGGASHASAGLFAGSSKHGGGGGGKW